ncbi:ArsR/SmtB family transcription factor [Fictibacillus aquaticus]|uniref:Transcriptional regulator n=1 Tax=Fictibacillus aquaticus TaxID=2021314 RepID=A0A235FEL2_9BACL|nr:metalloregulator ArsR/SmtB family transcription factor [Fictibacillus aquaticus]OYD59433.1 transcriptional regulator [Fictibacillus aquaticus]
MGLHLITAMNALSEPNRFQIVELLRDGPLTVGEIAVKLGMLQPQTSKHLRVLNKAGIVKVEASANKRIYHLQQEPFQDIDAWLGSFRQLWNDRFDRLEDYLKQMQENENNN